MNKPPSLPSVATNDANSRAAEAGTEPDLSDDEFDTIIEEPEFQARFAILKSDYEESLKPIDDEIQRLLPLQKYLDEQWISAQDEVVLDTAMRSEIEKSTGKPVEPSEESYRKFARRNLLTDACGAVTLRIIDLRNYKRNSRPTLQSKYEQIVKEYALEKRAAGSSQKSGN